MRPSGMAPRFEPHHRKRGDARPGLGADRALELHQRPHRKAFSVKPLIAPVAAIGHCEIGQMHPALPETMASNSRPSGVSAA
jgi:hypothetical protein